MSSWVIQKYIPDKLYGFALNGSSNQEVFFHLGVFRPGKMNLPETAPPCKQCAWPDVPPPPILGESVDVEVATRASDERAPKATSVTRILPPTPLSGIIETFDAARGFGFIAGSDGQTYHLHRSEVLEGRQPVTGAITIFFPGLRQNRPRACHVKVCHHGR